MDEKYRTRVVLSVGFTALSAFGLLAYGALDYLPDYDIDNPSALYWLGGSSLAGIVAAITFYWSGQRAARASMVEVHGESTVIDFENSRKKINPHGTP